MQFYEYKGFTIYPAPKLSLEGNTWTVDFSIRSGDILKPFSTGYSFSTKGEAVFHCIDYGKRIIDGEVDDLTVADMSGS